MQTCKKCHQAIFEGHAYELGDDRWHIQCFKCFKCDKALGCNSNFLVLGNGSLVCSSCSYNCKQCGKKIDDLAILTGDKAYCSNCFKCRVCKLKIEDLRYARTSKGLFCMACHEDLVAKKKKHDLKRKQKEQLLSLLRPSQSSSSATLPPATTTSTTNTTSASAASSLTLLSSHIPSSQSQSAVATPAVTPATSTVPNAGNFPMAGTAGSTGTGSLRSESPGMTLSPAPEMELSKLTTHSPLPSKLATAGVPSASNIPSGALIISTSSKSLLPAPLSTPSLMPSLSARSPRDHETISVDSYTTFESPSARRELTELTEQLQQVEPALPQGEEISVIKARKRLERSFDRSLAPDDGAILDLIESFSEPTTPVTTLMKAESESVANKESAKTGALNTNALEPSAVVSPRTTTGSGNATANGLGPGALDSSLPIPVTSPSKNASYADLMYPNKNIMIISPSQFHDTEFHAASLVSATNPTANSTSDNNSHNMQSLHVNDDSIRPRSSVSSPMAKVNRQARVVETTDENSATEQKDMSPYYLQSAVTTPKKNQALAGPITSPPPLLALPQIPTTPGSRGGSSAAVERAELYEPKGLGLKGMELKGLEMLKATHTLKEATPSVSNLEDTIPADEPEEEKPSRTKSTRSKLLLRHKRSISGGLTSGSLSSRLGFFKLREESERSGNGANGERGHTRHVLEGSINGQAFTTPPLPYSSPFRQSVYRELHSRSASDTHTPFMNEGELEFDVGMLKAEITSLDSRRQALLADNMRLNSDRSRMKETLVLLELKLNSEIDRLESIRREISELSATQQRLEDENESLVERNRALEAQNQASQANQSNQANHSNQVSQLNQLIQAHNNQTSQTSLSTAHLGALGSQPPSINHNRASQFYDANSDHVDNMNALDAVSEDVAETQKATRLKFWRRPKVSITLTGFNQTIGHLANQAGLSGNGNSGNGSGALTKMSLSFSSNSLHPSGHTQSTTSDVSENNGGSGGAFKSFNSLITKSRSTNLLESFVNTSSGGNNNNNNNHNNNNGVGGGDVPLFSSTIQRRAVFEGQKVPLIVSRCLEEVEQRGMDVEGIYRLSGGNSAIAAIENAFASVSVNADRKQANKITELLSGDINAVTSALKRYLRKLPDPLIPFALYSSFTKVGQSKTDTNERCQELVMRVILRLPSANKHALYLIGKHLDKVNYYSSVNRMNFKNLSVVFAPTIARDATGEREIMDMGARNEATELLFANFSTIFANYNE